LGSYRERIDIMADILRVAENFVKKTHIMFRANLSYRVLKKYLAELIAASLIRYNDDKRCYILTDKGRKFLVLYEEYSKVNRHVEQRMKDARLKKRTLNKMFVSSEMHS
jgi:predicted transcriptional regulator